MMQLLKFPGKVETLYLLKLILKATQFNRARMPLDEKMR
jgi:hypothetical protein